MMRTRSFTLVELMVVIGIIVVVAGVVYATTGPSREKARQVVCISNLRQIGQALAMYGVDYDANDSPSTPQELGIPPEPDCLLPYLGGSEEIFHCPNVPQREIDSITHGGAQKYCTYGWNVWTDDEDLPLPRWSDAVAKRGSQFPILYDDRHDSPPADRPASNKYVIVLRLDGSAKGLWVPHGRASWRW